MTKKQSSKPRRGEEERGGKMKKPVLPLLAAALAVDNKLFWEEYFRTYDILNEAIPYQKLMENLTEACEAKKGDLIFDAGSGTGNLCIRLKENGSKPIGFDSSEKAIEIHLAKDKDANVIFGDLTDRLPFPDNVFDKVVSNNVLYTISKNMRLNIIKEFYRILKPNGKLVIANVHNKFNPLIIFFDHFKLSIKLKGVFRTVIDLQHKAWAIGKMFYYSYYLIGRDRNGEYPFMEKDEQRILLLQAGFRNIHDTVKTYSDQSYMDIGVK
jgi:ubiquinone/menaquinone biosynthesis C-methylase UbiE